MHGDFPWNGLSDGLGDGVDAEGSVTPLRRSYDARLEGQGRICMVDYENDSMRRVPVAP